VTILDAVEVLDAEGPDAEVLGAQVRAGGNERRSVDGAGDGGTGEADTSYLLTEIRAVSAALRHTEEITAVRTHAAAPAESMSAHE
jgi:hypothetical protein